MVRCQKLSEKLDAQASHSRSLRSDPELTVLSSYEKETTGSWIVVCTLRNDLEYHYGQMTKTCRFWSVYECVCCRTLS